MSKRISRVFGSVILLVGVFLAIVGIAELARDDWLVGVASLVGALALIGMGGSRLGNKK